MQASVIIVVACVAGAVVVSAALIRWLRTRKQDAERRVRESLAGEQISLMDDRANCFGVESAGAAQVRGNGCLALGATRLVFAMWVPRRLLTIPRDRITAIEQPRSHLGKSTVVRLLKVRFASDDGAADSVAWAVRKLDQWVEALGEDGAGVRPRE